MLPLIQHLHPLFKGENYQEWAVKMKAHLRGLGLWQWIEDDRELPHLENNSTLNHIRTHEDEAAKQKLQELYL